MEAPSVGQLGVLGLGSFARVILYSRPTIARGVSRFSGAAMVATGGGLIVERLLAGGG